MNRALLTFSFFAFLFSAASLIGQDYTCPFEEEDFEGILFIDPQPYVEETMTGGIPDTACANTPYEFTFKVSIPDTAVALEAPGVGTIETVIDSFVMDPTTAIGFEPALSDFAYVCDPPDCIFRSGDTGCIKIYGTPTTDELDDHEVQLNAFFYPDFLGGLPFAITFPDPDLFPGTYTINVQDQSFGNCLVAGVRSLADEVSIEFFPNPFVEQTRLVIEAEASKRYEFRVVDMLGKIHHTQIVDAVQGINVVEYDGSRLAPGMYFLNLTDGRGVLTRKIIRK